MSKKSNERIKIMTKTAGLRILDYRKAISNALNNPEVTD
jgi:hypothetical protein